jgi:hypothetical protein
MRDRKPTGGFPETDLDRSGYLSKTKWTDCLAAREQAVQNHTETEGGGRIIQARHIQTRNGNRGIHDSMRY